MYEIHELFGSDLVIRRSEGTQRTQELSYYRKGGIRDPESIIQAILQARYRGRPCLWPVSLSQELCEDDVEAAE